MAEGGADTAADDGAPPRLDIDSARGRALITLQRPRHHNRLHRDDLLTLQRHFATAGATPGLRVLVITGTGRSFSAGFHLGEMGTADATGEAPASAPSALPAADDGPRLFEQTVDALEALRLPSIARLNGGVFGGATDLALACDFRIGVRGLALRMPAAQIGLHYYPGGLRRFVAKLGLAAAKRLFLLAPTLQAEELLALGYLDRIADSPEALDAEVEAMASTLAANAPLAVQGMKRSLDEIAGGEVDPARLRQREAACAASADLREGLAALAQRRAPRFTGQ